MYCEHFGLEILPFKISPDPAFLFENSQNRRALKMLRSDVVFSTPISVVTGDVGTGKTTLVLNALQNTPDDMTVGLLSNFPGWADDIMPWVLATFDIPGASDKISRLDAFVEFAAQERAAGRKVVLIVDEAQNVTHPGLEQLRELADVTAGKEDRFFLVLVGQSEFAWTLKRPECAALAQRVGITITLGAMTPSETDAYIRHRLAVAGGDPDIFDPEATAAVHDLSGGYPRLVNLVCDTAMVLAFGTGDRHVTRDTIQMIGESDSILSHLPDLVRKAREIPVRDDPDALSPVPSEPQAAVDLGECDVFEFVSPRQTQREPERTGPANTAADPETHTPPPLDRADDVGAARSAGANRTRDAEGTRTAVSPAPSLGHEERSSERRGRSGLRIFLGGALAASVAAGGVFLANPDIIPAGLGPLQTELASPRSAVVLGPVVPEGITQVFQDAPKPLADLPGEALLDRALSAGFDDPTAASIDYARAALRGEDIAAYYLGQLYETGDGVPRDLALARNWYASVEGSVRGARRRLQDLGSPQREGDLAPPIPLLGGALDSGGAEFVWSSGDGTDPAYFVVELSEGPSSTVRRLPPQSLSALRTEGVGAARFWRVIAVAPDLHGYAVSGWAPLGPQVSLVTDGSGGIMPEVVVQMPDGVSSAPLESLIGALDASRIPYRVEQARTSVSKSAALQIAYFFEGDAATARTIANAIGADVDMMLASVKGEPMPIPGKIVVFPASD